MVRIIRVPDDGTTTFTATDADAHAIRDDLARIRGSLSDRSYTFLRLLEQIHGDAGYNNDTIKETPS